MASYTGQTIGCWVVGEELKRDSQLSVYKVYNEKNSEEKYLLAINQDLLANPSDEDDADESCLLPVNINCRPVYTYYDNHCFPIIPPSDSCGSYHGNEYFVFEKVSRSLSSIVSDSSLDVSDNDLLITANQILEILRILFEAQRVLKNLHVNDFFFRRTTKGYRTVLLNQDFVTKECFFIEDPTFTSVSVMNGKEPTPSDNLHSLAYILVFLSQGSLPWIGRSDAEIKEMKESPALMHCSPFDDVVPLLLSDAPPLEVIGQCQALLRAQMTGRALTLGQDVSSFTKKKHVQPQRASPPQTPVKAVPTTAPISPNRVVVVAGQRYEVKVVNGKRLMEPIASPVPPIRSARAKLRPASSVGRLEGKERGPLEDRPAESMRLAEFVEPAMPAMPAMPAVPAKSTGSVEPMESAKPMEFVVSEAREREGRGTALEPPVLPKVRREKRERALSETGSKRMKTQRIESRSIVGRANRFVTSSLFSSFLFTVAVLAAEGMHSRLC